MSEIWKPVVGFEGDFEVSDLGRVRRLFDGGREGWRILKATKHGSANSYLVVNLSREGARATGRRRRKGDYVPGTRRYCKVHRLVLEAFVGPCPPGHQSLHANDDGFDNRLDNLRWGTFAENCEDMKRNGKRKGSRNGRSKLTEAQVLEIRSRYAADPFRGHQSQLAAEFGVSSTLIGFIIRNKNWTEEKAA